MEFWWRSERLGGEDPLRTLERRLARGDIDREEFEATRRTLAGE